MVGTPGPQPTEVRLRTAIGIHAGEEVEVELEHGLGRGAAAVVVEGSHLLTGDQRKLLAVDDHLEGSLGTRIIVLADESLALEGVSILLGDTESTRIAEVLIILQGTEFLLFL